MRKKLILSLALLIELCVPWTRVHAQTELLHETFDGITSGVPAGWDNSEGTAESNYSWSSNSYGYSGRGLDFDSYNATSGKWNALKTPTLKLDKNYSLSFKYKNYQAGTFDVYISLDGGATYTTAIATGLTTSTSSEWGDAEYSLADYKGNDNVKVVFKSVSNWGWYIQYLDDVVIAEEPPVVPLQSISATSTRTTVTATWKLKGGKQRANYTGYEVKLTSTDDPEGTAIASATVSDPTTLTCTFEHLSRETTYYVHARVNGGTDGYSSWTTNSVTTKGLTEIRNSIIADGTLTTNYLPVYGYYADEVQKSQSIYPASMLTGLIGKSITKLKYYVSSLGSNGDGWFSSTFNIRMMETTSATLSDFISTSEATLVYSGTLNASVAGGMEINLTTPYIYKGGNLLIEFDLPVKASWKECTFYCTEVTDASRYKHSTTASGSSSLPKVSIGYKELLEACPAATGMTVSDLLQTTATVSWDPSTADYFSSYDVLVSTTPVTDFSTATPQYTGLTDPTVALTGLTKYTDYYVYVRTNAQAWSHDDGHSWSEALTFKTLPNILIPTDLTATLTSKAAVTVTWTPTSQPSNYRYILSKTPIADPDNAATTATGLTDCNVQLTGLDYDTTYYFYLSNQGESETSPYISTTFTTLPVAIAPTELKVTDVHQYELTLEWTDHPLCDEGDSYDVVVSDTLIAAANIEAVLATAKINPDGTLHQKGYEGITGDTKTVTLLERNTKYYFYVRANSGAEHSVWVCADTTTLDLPLVYTEMNYGNEDHKVDDLPTTRPGYKYSVSEQIYTFADNQRKSGNICDLSFYVTSGSVTRNLNIYLAHTAKSSFESKTDFVKVTDADLVYSGNFTFSAGKWNTIMLDSIFHYDGMSNLLLVVDDNTGSYSSTVKFQSTFSSNKSIYSHSDQINFDPKTFSSFGSTSNQANYLNNIKFTISNPANLTPTPECLTPEDITATSAFIKWKKPNSDHVSTYDLMISEFMLTKPDSVWDQSETTFKLTLTDTCKLVTGLKPLTPYWVYVRAHYDKAPYNDGKSGWFTNRDEPYFITQPACKNKNTDIDYILFQLATDEANSGDTILFSVGVYESDNVLVAAGKQFVVDATNGYRNSTTFTNNGDVSIFGGEFDVSKIYNKSLLTVRDMTLKADSIFSTGSGFLLLGTDTIRVAKVTGTNPLVVGADADTAHVALAGKVSLTDIEIKPGSTLSLDTAYFDSKKANGLVINQGATVNVDGPVTVGATSSLTLQGDLNWRLERNPVVEIKTTITNPNNIGRKTITVDSKKCEDRYIGSYMSKPSATETFYLTGESGDDVPIVANGRPVTYAGVTYLLTTQTPEVKERTTGNVKKTIPSEVEKRFYLTAREVYPEIAVTTADKWFKKGETVTIEGTYADHSTKGIREVKVLGTGQNAEPVTFENNAWSYVYTGPNANGKELKFVVVDGNSYADTATYSLKVDTVAPYVDAVKFRDSQYTTVTNYTGQAIAVPASLVFNIALADTTSGGVGNVCMELDGTAWTATEEYNYETSTGKLTTVAGAFTGKLGPCVLTFTATDAAGNQMTQEININFGVCKIKEKYYETIDNALAEVKTGETIKLITNVETKNRLELPSGTYLDLKGYTLTNPVGLDLVWDITKDNAPIVKDFDRLDANGTLTLKLNDLQTRKEYVIAQDANNATDKKFILTGAPTADGKDRSITVGGEPVFYGHRHYTLELEGSNIVLKVKKVTPPSGEFWGVSVDGSQLSLSIDNNYNVSHTGDSFVQEDNLTHFHFNGPITRIGVATLKGNLNLKEVYFPASVEFIGQDAIRDCENLEYANMHDITATAIGPNAFEGCKKLSIVEWPAQLEEIDAFAFAYCESLEDITLPATLQRIYGNAFSYCPNLKSVTLLSPSMERLWAESFDKCHKDLAIYVPYLNLTDYEALSSARGLNFQTKIPVSNDGSDKNTVYCHHNMIIPDGVTFWTMNTNLTEQKVTQQFVPGGAGYVVKFEAGINSVEVVTTSQLATTIANRNILTGVNKATEVSEILKGYDGTTLCKMDPSTGSFYSFTSEMPAYQAFYVMQGGIPVSFTYDEATGIANVDVDPELVEGDADADSDSYNAAGQKVANGYKGIVIKNGKKYLNK